jgi:SOS-response transcriptional repressor LexA
MKLANISRSASQGTSDGQVAVLRAIEILTARRNGIPPTVREVAAEIGQRHTNDVYEKLLRLRRDGLVEWEPGLCRTLRLKRESK